MFFSDFHLIGFFYLKKNEQFRFLYLCFFVISNLNFALFTFYFHLKKVKKKSWRETTETFDIMDSIQLKISRYNIYCRINMGSIFSFLFGRKSHAKTQKNRLTSIDKKEKFEKLKQKNKEELVALGKTIREAREKEKKARERRAEEIATRRRIRAEKEKKKNKTQRHSSSRRHSSSSSSSLPRVP